MIGAGERDRRINILKRRVAKNLSGEQIEYFDDKGLNPWAKVTPMTGKDYFDARQVHAEETVRFNILYRTDFDTYDRIEYQGQQFRIAHRAEVGRREAWELVGVLVATPTPAAR